VEFHNTLFVMSGLYIHIPFCAKRCIYCDFYSCTHLQFKEAYLAALLREMEIRKDVWKDAVFETIYFGGGTPSLLDDQELKRLFEGIYRNFTVTASPEITLEANPDDLTGDFVSALKDLPVNRISIGVQSFNDTELRFLNRRHTARQALDAIERCRKTGLTNISIDLMYGLPEQTATNWSQTIEKALELDVPHLSAYHLSCEEGTKLDEMMKNGAVKPIDEEVSETLFRLLIEKLTKAGFVHYEISNFARRTSGYPHGCISLHNSSYWKGIHYLGLGASAHSYDGASRSWNIASITDYITNVRENPDVLSETEWLDERAKYNDYIITRLRTMWGISLNELRRTFGKVREDDFLEKSAGLICRKMLKNQGDCVKVSLKGLFISDAIMRELIV